MTRSPKSSTVGRAVGPVVMTKPKNPPGWQDPMWLLICLLIVLGLILFVLVTIANQ